MPGRVKSAIYTSFEKQTLPMVRCGFMPVPTFSKPNNIRTDISPFWFLFLVFLQNCHNSVSTGKMILTIKKKKFYPDCESSMWHLLLKQMCGMSLTSAGGHQCGEANCILRLPPRKPKLLGVSSTVRAAMQSRKDSNPKSMGKVSSTGPHLFSLFVAAYNDFIKNMGNHFHYFKMPYHLKRRKKT